MVGFAERYLPLEIVEPRVGGLAHSHDLEKDLLLALAQRLELPRTVVQDSDRARQAQRQGPARDRQRVFRVAHRTAQHRVDVDVKLGVLGQHFELLVQDLETFLRDFIRHDVVDRDLQVVQAGAVEPRDALGRQQVTVGDQTGDDAAPANAPDDFVELGMKQRLATADGDDRGAQCSKPVDAAKHLRRGDRLGEAVKLVAVSARQVTAPDGDNVSVDGMAGGEQSLGDHPPLADATAGGASRAPEDDKAYWTVHGKMTERAQHLRH